MLLFSPNSLSSRYIFKDLKIKLYTNIKLPTLTLHTSILYLKINKNFIREKTTSKVDAGNQYYYSVKTLLFWSSL